MAAVRSDRIGIPIGIRERRVLAWLRASAGDAALRDRGAHVVWHLREQSGSLVEEDRADHVGGTIQARPVVAAR